MFRTTLRGRCPACGEGRLFDGFTALKPTCEHCAVRFERDPGAFLGAMAIVYFLAVAVATPLGVWLYTRGGFGWIEGAWVAGAASATAVLSYRFVKAWWTWLLYVAGEVTTDADWTGPRARAGDRTHRSGRGTLSGKRTASMLPIALASVAGLGLGGCTGTSGGTNGGPHPDAATAPTSVAAAVERDAGRPPLDYGDPDHWACSPAGGDPCDQTYTVRVEALDGTHGEALRRPAADPPLDCFHIYPTVDLSFAPGNHDDMDDLYLPTETVRAQAALFSQACRVIAPYYRQGTIGSYSARLSEATGIFLNAFNDVAAAFEHYLREWNDGRPLVIMGHSQGAQMASYLLHRYFDGATRVTTIAGSETSDALRRRLVAALPIGFNVYVPAGEDRGGSFADIPLCTAPDQAGCVIHYRSYAEDHPLPKARAGGFAVDAALADRGYLHQPFDDWTHRLSCVNPATLPVAPGGTATDGDGRAIDPSDEPVRVLGSAEFLGVIADLGLGSGEADLVAVPRRYTATCREDRGGGGYLAVGLYTPPGTDVAADRRDPIPIDSPIARGAIGLHLWDMNLAMGDLVEQVRTRYEVWAGE